ERAEALLGEQLLRFAQGDSLRLRIPALREIPGALAAPPADDSDLAAGGENLEHQSHLPGAPPLVPLLVLPAPVCLDLAGEQGAALLELAQHVAPEWPVRREPVARVPVERPTH